MMDAEKACLGRVARRRYTGEDMASEIRRFQSPITTRTHSTHFQSNRFDFPGITFSSSISNSNFKSQYPVLFK